MSKSTGNFAAVWKLFKAEDPFKKCIDLFTTRNKVVHNGGCPNFQGSLFDKKDNLFGSNLTRYVLSCYQNSLHLDCLF